VEVTHLEAKIRSSKSWGLEAQRGESGRFLRRGGVLNPGPHGGRAIEGAADVWLGLVPREVIEGKRWNRGGRRGGPRAG
jgi:hypothetical protein